VGLWVVQLIYMVARSSEFSSIVVREEEQPELETLMRKTCPLHVRGGAEDKHGKISILIQASAATHPPPHLTSLSPRPRFRWRPTAVRTDCRSRVSHARLRRDSETHVPPVPLGKPFKLFPLSIL
jgi:hypothetical protein